MKQSYVVGLLMRTWSRLAASKSASNVTFDLFWSVLRGTAWPAAFVSTPLFAYIDAFRSVVDCMALLSMVREREEDSPRFVAAGYGARTKPYIFFICPGFCGRYV